MINKRRLFLFSLFIVLFFNGCEDTSTGNTIGGLIGFKSELSPYVLNGTVVDAFNNPVIGANIHFLFTQKESGFSKTQISQSSKTTISITFSINKESRTSLRLYRLGTREYITLLLDTTLRAGKYTRTIDANNITNGIYIYQLIYSGTYAEHLLMIYNENVNALIKVTPVTRTDVQGKFRLPQSIFGFEEEFLYTSENTGEIIKKTKIDSIGIVVYRHDKTPLIQWMNINKYTDMEQTYTLH